MNIEVNSVYQVTNYTTQESETIAVSGAGQALIPVLRKQYPAFGRNFYKLVLKGHQINGKFVALKINQF